MIICGIDPGKKGGLAILDESDLISVIPMPLIDDSVDFKLVKDFLIKHKPSKIIIEAVHAMPRQGVCSMFNFGFSTGGLHGVCCALDLPITTVQPRTWQKTLMGDAKHEKEDTIAWVINKFPSVNLLATPRSKKPHDGMSDSIAIGYYGISYLN